MKDIDKKVTKVGKVLTLVITLPIIGFMMFGWIGGIVALVIALAFM